MKPKAITQSRIASVWDAIERDPSAAAHMKLRAEIMVHLQEALAARSGTQQDKADWLGISQPRLNDLLQGRIERFSLDALVDLVQAEGGEVEVRIRSAPASARLSVHEARSRYGVAKKTPVRRKR